MCEGGHKLIPGLGSRPGLLMRTNWGLMTALNGHRLLRLWSTLRPPHDSYFRGSFSLITVMGVSVELWQQVLFAILRSVIKFSGPTLEVHTAVSADAIWAPLCFRARCLWLWVSPAPLRWFCQRLVNYGQVWQHSPLPSPAPAVTDQAWGISSPWPILIQTAHSSPH